MIRRFASIALSAGGLALAVGLLTANPAEAASGYIQIHDGSNFEIIANPSGCITPTVTPSILAAANDTNATVELYSRPGCSGVTTALAPGASKTGTYGSIYVP